MGEKLDILMDNVTFAKCCRKKYGEWETQKQAFRKRHGLGEKEAVFWKETTYETLHEYTIKNRTPYNCVVLSVDIRKSTLMMKEFQQFETFAIGVRKFVEKSQKILKDHGGWFDKFTGDGFLAYWWLADENENKPDESANQNKPDGSADKNKANRPRDFIQDCVLKDILQASKKILCMYHQQILPLMRRSLLVAPCGLGVSIGLDVARTYLLESRDDFTIVGRGVVGAVRMVNCAKPWEVICNNNLGEYLYRKPYIVEFTHANITQEYRETKECPKETGGQLVFPIKFDYNFEEYQPYRQEWFEEDMRTHEDKKENKQEAQIFEATSAILDTTKPNS